MSDLLGWKPLKFLSVVVLNKGKATPNLFHILYHKNMMWDEDVKVNRRAINKNVNKNSRESESTNTTEVHTKRVCDLWHILLRESVHLLKICSQFRGLSVDRCYYQIESTNWYRKIFEWSFKQCYQKQNVTKTDQPLVHFSRINLRISM